MNKQELIKRIGQLFAFGSRDYIERDRVLELVKQLDEPETGHADEAPRYVKNILARLRELPEHDREVWLKVIMGEFEEEFSHAKWCEGYEQGKLEGMVEREKVKVPPFVADWIKYCKRTGVNLYNALDMGDLYFYNYANQKDDLKLKEFFETDTNQETFARAWLDGYEVEKEKRYYVKAKTIGDHNNYLKYNTNQKHWYFGSRFIYVNDVDTKIHHTRKELEEAGFGWVFNCEGIEIEEVE